eukprot:13565564-Alexandrium_andersonii.AAC.1
MLKVEVRCFRRDQAAYPRLMHWLACIRSRPVYAHAVGPLARAIQRRRTCAKRSLHMQRLSCSDDSHGDLRNGPSSDDGEAIIAGGVRVGVLVAVVGAAVLFMHNERLAHV